MAQYYEKKAAELTGDDFHSRIIVEGHLKKAVFLDKTPVTLETQEMQAKNDPGSIFVLPQIHSYENPKRRKHPLSAIFSRQAESDLGQ